jgi:hypothetical protein
MNIQDKEFGRKGTILGMAQQELAGAREARAQATAALGEGLGALAGGVLGDDKLRAGAGKLFGKIGGFLGIGKGKTSSNDDGGGSAPM